MAIHSWYGHSLCYRVYTQSLLLHDPTSYSIEMFRILLPSSLSDCKPVTYVFVCVYVCVCIVCVVCVCLCVCAVCVFAVCVFVCVYVCVCVCMCLCVYVCVCMCVLVLFSCYCC